MYDSQWMNNFLNLVDVIYWKYWKHYSFHHSLVFSQFLKFALAENDFIFEVSQLVFHSSDFFRQCAAVIMKLAIKNWCFISFRGWSWTWCQFFNIIHNRFHLLQRKKSNGHAILLSPTPCLPIHLFRNSVCTEFLARIHVRHVIFLVNRVV